MSGRVAQIVSGLGGLGLAATAFLPLLGQPAYGYAGDTFAPIAIVGEPGIFSPLLAPYLAGLLVALAALAGLAGAVALRHAITVALLALAVAVVAGGAVLMGLLVSDGAPAVPIVAMAALWVACAALTRSALAAGKTMEWRLARVTSLGGAVCASGFLLLAAMAPAYGEVFDVGGALALLASLVLVCGGRVAERAASAPGPAVPAAVARRPR